MSYIQYRGKKKVDNSQQAWPGIWGSKISIQSANEGGNVVSLTHQPPLTLGKYFGN